MEILKNILAIIHHFYPFCGILAGFLLFLRYKSGNRSRLFLAVCFGLAGIITLVMLCNNYGDLRSPMDVLQIEKLNGGLLVFLMFFFIFLIIGQKAGPLSVGFAGTL